MNQSGSGPGAGGSGEQVWGAPEKAGRGGARRRWRRIALWGGGGLVLLLLALVALAPSIASSVAPGMVARSVSGSIPGSVRIADVRLGWSGPTEIGPVTLLDEQGQPVGTFAVSAPAGLWRIVRERWWSAKRIALGTVEVTGDVDVVRGADGRTNLERALGINDPSAPPRQPSGPARMPPGGIERIDAVIRLVDVDATFVDRTAPPGSPTAQGLSMRDLSGDIDVDYAASAAGIDAAVKADLAAAIRGGTGAAAGVKQTISLDGKAQLGRTFGVHKIEATLRVGDLSTALVDLFGGFNGELVASIGPTVSLAADVNGTAQGGRAAIVLTAEGAGADLKLTYDGTRLVLEEPGRVWARSTGFIAGLDVAEEGIRRAGEAVRLSAAPGFDASVRTLSIPITTAQLTGSGGSSGGAGLLERLDLRGAQIDLTVRTDAMEGEAAVRAGAGEREPDAWRPFRVEPVELAVHADDLARGVRIASQASASVDGRPAGALSANLLAAGVIDAQGRPVMGLPRSINGEVRLDDVATQLVQPIVDGLGLPVVLGEDVGPAIDVALIAQTEGDLGAGVGEGLEALPPTNIDAAVRSQNITGQAALRIECGVAMTREGGATLRIASAGPLMARVLRDSPGEDAEGVTVGGRAGVEVSVTQLRLPLDGRAADLAETVAALTATVSEMTLGVRGEDVGIERAQVGVSLPADAGPRLALEAALLHEGSPFTARGDLTLPRLRGGGGEPMEGGVLGAALGWQPRGKFEVRGIPGSLMSLAPGLEAGEEGEPGPEDVSGQVRRWARALIGQRADVTVDILPADGGGGGDGEPVTRVNIAASAAAAALEAAATLSPSRLSVLSANAFASLQPRDVNPVLAAAAPPAPSSAPMRLRDAVTVRLGVEPVTIALRRGEEGGAPAPDLGDVEQIVATLTADQPVLIENVALGETPQTVGLGALAVRARVPGSLIGGEGRAGEDGAGALILVNAAADLLRAGGAIGPGAGAQTLGRLTAEASLPPDLGTLAATVDAAELRVPAIDAMLEQGGTLTGVLGETGRVRAHVQKQGEASFTVTAEVETPRLSGTPVPLATDGQRLWLSQPAELTWRPDLVWLNRAVLASGEVRGGEVIGRPAGGPAAAAPAAAQPEITEMAPLTIELGRLAVAVPQSDPRTGQPVSGPLLPGVFNLAAAARTARVVMDQGGGRGAIALSGVSLTLNNAGDTAVLAFDLAVDQVEGAGVAAQERARVAGRIEDLADARGVPTPETASLSMSGSFPALPTPIIDALAQQGGVLAEALGPTVSVRVEATRLSRQGGVLRASATSERAEATIGGRVQNGAFVQTEPTQVTLRVITPQLVQELGGSLPVVGTLEKRREDQPAVIRTENLTLPIDGDLSKLSGRVTIDPGVARFSTYGGFAALLRALDQRERGMIGGKIEPFVVNMHNGVLSYDRFRLPLGEFTLETKGSVDLVNRRMDLVTYVPFFALTDEVAGRLSTGLGGVAGALPGGIDRATLVPLRTSGPLDNPRTDVDMQLFVQEFGGNLLQTPGRIIDDTIRKRLEDLLRPGRDGGGGGGK